MCVYNNFLEIKSRRRGECREEGGKRRSGRRGQIDAWSVNP